MLSIRHGNQLELLEAPAILGETAILADTVPLCEKRPYTLRAVRIPHYFQTVVHLKIPSFLLKSLLSVLQRPHGILKWQICLCDPIP